MKVRKKYIPFINLTDINLLFPLLIFRLDTGLDCPCYFCREIACYLCISILLLGAAKELILIDEKDGNTGCLR